MIKVIKNINKLLLFSLLFMPSLLYSQGSRYEGSYKKSSEISYTNTSNIVIEGLELSNIELRDCHNITIKNCKLGPTAKKAIYLYKCSNITVIDCEFEKIQTGLLAEYCTGNIKFEHNDVKNLQGERGNESVQMTQYVHLSGPGNSVSYNACENIAGESSVEDVISMYASNGTAQSPIMIVGNWIRGGGPSQTSGGIMLGDSGGSFQIAENNILVNPGQYGISISGGHDLILRNNKAYSKKLPHSNVGLVVWDWWAWKETGANPLHNITVENNQLNWTNRDGILNTTYIHSNAGVIKGLESNKHTPSLNEAILPDVILNRAKRTDNNIPDIDKPDDTTKPEGGTTDPSDTTKPDDIIQQDDTSITDDTTKSDDKNKPEIDKPDNNTSEPQIFNIFTDLFNRVSIKCLTSPIPFAVGEIHTSTGQVIASKNLSGFRSLFNNVLKPGQYKVVVTYDKPSKTETQIIIIE